LLLSLTEEVVVDPEPLHAVKKIMPIIIGPLKLSQQNVFNQIAFSMRGDVQIQYGAK
jgi:hypothetical protein